MASRKCAFNFRKCLSVHIVHFKFANLVFSNVTEKIEIDLNAKLNERFNY